jgi:hypothetical protein
MLVGRMGRRNVVLVGEYIIVRGSVRRMIGRVIRLRVRRCRRNKSPELGMIMQRVSFWGFILFGWRKLGGNILELIGAIFFQMTVLFGWVGAWFLLDVVLFDRYIV